MNNGYVFDGSGTCTGTINGVAATNRAVLARVANSNATLSCGFSASTSGQGTLIFVNGVLDSQGAAGDVPDTVVSFQLTEASAGTEVPLVVQGLGGGLAAGEASFRSSAGPGTITSCAGAGVHSLGFSATVRTIQPLVG